MPILRVNNVTLQNMLPGVRQVAQRTPTGGIGPRIAIANEEGLTETGIPGSSFNAYLSIAEFRQFWWKQLLNTRPGGTHGKYRRLIVSTLESPGKELLYSQAVSRVLLATRRRFHRRFW